eukprot:560731-Amphidinium_carterae.1
MRGWHLHHVHRVKRSNGVEPLKCEIDCKFTLSWGCASAGKSIRSLDGSAIYCIPDEGRSLVIKASRQCR